MEKLTAFLEEENRKLWDRLDYDPLVQHIISERDTRLINTILDIVGEEMEKEYEDEHDRAQCLSKKDIKQILTNLKK